MSAIWKSRSRPTSGQNMGHCIAAWYSLTDGRSEGPSKPELELHVNLWRLDRKLNGVKMDALDLGFRVSKATSVASVHLYVPFLVDSTSITDLGTILTDLDIAVAIFNEDAEVRRASVNQPSFSIKLGNAQLSCWELQPKSDLSFETLGENYPNGGTIINFNTRVFAVDSDETERYVRLRIKLSEALGAAFFTRYDPPDRHFLSGFDEIEVVDFRFNEARNLPRSVTERMKGRFNISEINYFVIRNITDDLIISHSELKKCRTLESVVWSKYVNDGQTTAPPLQNAIIYYWQKKIGTPHAYIKDYNAFARFRKRKTGCRAIFSFLFYTLLIGIIAGLISGAFGSYLAPNLATLPPGNSKPAAQSEPSLSTPPAPPTVTGQKSTSD